MPVSVLEICETIPITGAMLRCASKKTVANRLWFTEYPVQDTIVGTRSQTSL